MHKILSPSSDDLSLYIHLPFCTKKCDYCHFFVLPDKESFKDQLLESLLLEIRVQKEKISGKQLKSIYFGGGTPALFSPQRIEILLKAIHRLVPYDYATEVTLEANPENITLPLMKDYLSAGINRVSIGIQSFSSPLLLQLNRAHNAQKAQDSVWITQQAGFSNLCIDLMIDLPQQNLDDLTQSLKTALSLPIQHLSLYNLTIEPHTVFYKKRKELQKTLPPERLSKQLFQTAHKTLAENGFEPYEISAFAKNSYHSIHNSGYWIARPFLGLGPSAYSFYGGQRFRNIAHLKRYSEALKKGLSPVDFQDNLRVEERKKELLAVHLRLTQGICLENFQKYHGPVQQETLHALQELQEQDLLLRKDSQISLTEKGILFYDFVASEII